MSQLFIIPKDFGKLQSGEELDENAFLAYDTHGVLNEDKNNCVLWVTCYTQRSTDMVDPFIGEGKRFDPENGLFIITVNMPGNGLSFSPTSAGIKWPTCGLTYNDNAKMVNLLMQSLGIQCVALMYGFSMGAMIAFEYCVQFPSQVKSAITVCGSAKCNLANGWFLQHLADALRSDPSAEVDLQSNRILGFNGQRQPEAMNTFAQIYADWIFDGPRPERDGAVCPNSARPPFARCIIDEGRSFKDKLHGAQSTEEWFEVFRKRYSKWHAIEYYEVSDTWRRGDVSVNPVFRGDLKKALQTVQAKMWIRPSTTDQYFRAEEIKLEAEMVPNAIFQPLESSLGHFAEFDDTCQASINETIQAALKHAGL